MGLDSFGKVHTHLDGSDVTDQFEYSVDCSGEQYTGDGAADLGAGSEGWDYTDDCGFQIDPLTLVMMFVVIQVKIVRQ